MRVVFLVLAVALGFPALAAPPNAATLERFFTATQVEKQIEGMRQMSEGMMRSAVQRHPNAKSATPEQQKRVEAQVARMAATIREEMGWAKVKPLLVQVYSANFTEEEMLGIAAFYESAAGRAVIAKMPVVMQKSMGALQERMDPLMRRFEADIQAAVASKNPVAPKK